MIQRNIRIPRFWKKYLVLPINQNLCSQIFINKHGFLDDIYQCEVFLDTLVIIKQLISNFLGIEWIIIVIWRHSKWLFI